MFSRSATPFDKTQIGLLKCAQIVADLVHMANFFVGSNTSYRVTPLSLAHLKFHNVCALQLPLGLRTLTSFFQNHELERQILQFRSLQSFRRWLDKLRVNPRPRTVDFICWLPHLRG